MIDDFPTLGRPTMASLRGDDWRLTVVAIPSSGAETGDKRFRILDVAMKRHQYQPDSLIEVLHKAQELFGFLDAGVLHYVARGLRLPPSRVYGVVTFYHLFTLKPQGEHTCVVCMGTACFVKGADRYVSRRDSHHGGEGLRCALSFEKRAIRANAEKNLRQQESDHEKG